MILTQDKILIDDEVFSIKILFCVKKNSSARINGKEFILRISSLLSKRQKIEHIQSLITKLKKKVKLQKRSPFIKRISPFDHLFDVNVSNNDLIDSFITIGSVDLVNGDTYKIQLKRKPQLRNLSGRIQNKTISIFVPHFEITSLRSEIETIILKMTAKDQKKYIENFLQFLNNQYFQETINSIRLKNVITRWGSCSSKQNINISTKLLFLPYQLFEYVCIHELAHLKQHNHSKAFWKIVENILPDYKERRKHLRLYN